MRNRLILLFKLINRFGLAKGTTIFYKNSKSKKGVSSFRLKNYPYPLFLRRSTSDIHTFYHVFFDEEYKFPLDFSPEFIIDCGANVGLASLYFTAAYPGAKIVAVEPELSNYEMLLKNTEKYPDIECIRMGIWNTNAILKVGDDYNMGKWGFVCREVNEEDENTVRAVSISEIMRRYNKQEIDILKIDIEGGELELFSSNYEDWLPKTKVIVIELHDWVRKGCSKSFFTALMKYDFSVHRGVGENMVCIRN
jgi:FkbM family methyltransferase